MDAFKGSNVTPVRLRTVWSSRRCPNSYSSWISYANSFWDKKYYNVYDYIVERLFAVYGDIPSQDMVGKTTPALAYVPDARRPKKRRVNSKLQKLEYYVYVLKSPSIQHTMPGWSMLLRFFSEVADPITVSDMVEGSSGGPSYEGTTPLSVRLYTRPRTSMLVRRWR
nr:MAG: hypothetical protein H3Bulk415935_000002 [Leviviridae sp.]